MNEIPSAAIVPVRVSESLLSEVFEALRVWQKIEAGELTEWVGPDPPAVATAGWCAGGTSYYTRIVNRAGFRVGRVHYLYCPERGTVRFPSYLMLGETRLYRVGHDEPDPTA